jgi:hypothetical protein
LKLYQGTVCHFGKPCHNWPPLWNLNHPYNSCVTVFFFFFFFLWDLGLNTQDFTLTKQVLYHLSYTSSPFYSGYFGDGRGRGVSGTLCQGWSWTVIFPILPFQVTNITDVSPWCPAWQSAFISSYSYKSYMYPVIQLLRKERSGGSRFEASPSANS